MVEGFPNNILGILGNNTTPEVAAAYRKRELEGARLDEQAVISAHRPLADANDEELQNFRTCVIGNGRGKWLIAFYFDGRIEFNSDYDMHEHAKAFMLALSVFGTPIYRPKAKAEKVSATGELISGASCGVSIEYALMPSSGLAFDCKASSSVPAMDMTKLGQATNIKLNSEANRYSVAVKLQMPCGCTVGTHPPGPCGITGHGQTVTQPESPLTPKKRPGYINT